MTDGRLHYIGLGDRHSTTEVTDRIWFSGTQEVTAPPFPLVQIPGGTP